MKNGSQILRKYAVLFVNAFFVNLKLTQCMKIYDELNVAKYCTDQQELCTESESSSHIVCEYYGKIGSSCSSNYEEVPLDEEIAKDIIIRINSMRAKIATGIVMGKDRQLLPQGYGLMRVSWDSELASFARIMIRQCLTTHKYNCAANEYFGNPIMSFMDANTSSSPMTIINNIFLSWEASALQANPEDLLSCPDLRVGEKSSYIKMVAGNMTNVGCALGIYKHDISANTKSSGHMICYLSHYARTGTQVYKTTPPAPGTGWSKCGCPPMLRETVNCLCVGLPKLQRRYSNLTSIVATSLNPLPIGRQQQVTTTQPLNSTLKLTTQEKDFPQRQKLIQQTTKVILQEKPKTQRTLKQESPIQVTSIGTPTPPHESVGTPTPTCNGTCAPQIVMLPIFTIQNVPEHSSHNRHPSKLRRFHDTSSIRMRTSKAIDDFSHEQHDENLRSKLLRILREIRNNPNAHFFSNEENLEPDKRILESIQRKPHVRNLKTKQSNYNRKKEATKRVMYLLDLLEKKGNKALFTSREILEFDGKMRRIYQAVLPAHEKSIEM